MSQHMQVAGPSGGNWHEGLFTVRSTVSGHILNLLLLFHTPCVCRSATTPQCQPTS
jgi:hypothetical protein